MEETVGASTSVRILPLCASCGRTVNTLVMASSVASTAGASCAYATLITSDSFLMGVETMLYSLRATGTAQPIVVLVTDQVSHSTCAKIQCCQPGIVVKLVPSIPNPNTSVHMEGWVNSGYTKLNIWALCEFEKIVYIDADTVVMANVDDLFARPGDLCAAPDVFPPDRFNAGVLVIQPSMPVFEDMMSKIGILPSYDGGDTGFLNAYFPRWYDRSDVEGLNRLPFSYNAQRTLHWMTFTKQPGYWNAIQPIKILHFSSTPKPWEDGAKKGDLEMLWWEVYLQSKLTPDHSATVAAGSGAGGAPMDLIASFLG